MRADQFRVHADVEDEHWWFVGRRRILVDLAGALVAASGAGSPLVVDVGCGTGANAAAMSRHFRCVGVDVSEEAIAMARQRFPEVRFIHGPAPLAVGGLAAEADLFLLTDVLEHIEDDRRFLAGLVAAARPGAAFLLTVPADPCLWTEHDVSFGHYRRYVPRTLRAVWAGLPVAEVTLDGLNTRLAPMVRAVRWSNRRLGRTSGRAGTDFDMLPDPVNTALGRLFAAESGRLLRGLRAGRRCDRTRAVSLLSVLRRLPDPPGPRADA